MLKRYFEDDNQKILFLRHGELNTEGRRIYAGQTDVSLTGAGIGRAHTWAKALDNLGVTQIIASDLKRCAETADIIAAKLKLKARHSAQWREISFGDWDGRERAEVEAKYPEAVAARRNDFVNHRPPNGESFLDLQNRIVPAFNELISQPTPGHVLVVAHAGVNRVLLAYLMGLPPQNIFHIYQDFAGLNIVDVKDGKFKQVRAINIMA